MCLFTHVHLSIHLSIYKNIISVLASLVAQMLKYLPAVFETGVQSLGQKDPLEKETETHFNILAWKIP